MRMTISKGQFLLRQQADPVRHQLGHWPTKRGDGADRPSGCGKSTLLRALNRMHETVHTSRLEGEIHLDGQNILAQDVTRYGGEWAWCSSGRIRFQSRFSIT